MIQRFKCKHCEWEWDYKGKKILNKKYAQYISCPRCHSLIKIKTEEDIETIC